MRKCENVEQKKMISRESSSNDKIQLTVQVLGKAKKSLKKFLNEHKWSPQLKLHLLKEMVVELETEVSSINPTSATISSTQSVSEDTQIKIKDFYGRNKSSIT